MAEIPTWEISSRPRTATSVRLSLSRTSGKLSPRALGMQMRIIPPRVAKTERRQPRWATLRALPPTRVVQPWSQADVSRPLGRGIRLLIHCAGARFLLCPSRGSRVQEANAGFFTSLFFSWMSPLMRVSDRLGSPRHGNKYAHCVIDGIQAPARTERPL